MVRLAVVDYIARGVAHNHLFFLQGVDVHFGAEVFLLEAQACFTAAQFFRVNGVDILLEL